MTMMQPGDGGSPEQAEDEPAVPGDAGEGAGSAGERAAADLERTGEEGAGAGESGEGTQAASYEAAVERLEQIIERLDSGQAGLRETLELCREGRDLVAYCAGELDEVGEGLKELRLDELAEGLERTREPPDSQ